MSTTIDSALLFVFYAVLFVGSLLGVTAAGIGLLGPSFIGLERRYAFRNGTVVTFGLLVVGLVNQFIAATLNNDLSVVGYILLGVLAVALLINAIGWLICTRTPARSNPRREQTA